MTFNGSNFTDITRVFVNEVLAAFDWAPTASLTPQPEQPRQSSRRVMNAVSSASSGFIGCKTLVSDVPEEVLL